MSYKFESINQTDLNARQSFVYMGLTGRLKAGANSPSLDGRLALKSNSYEHTIWHTSSFAAVGSNTGRRQHLLEVGGTWVTSPNGDESWFLPNQVKFKLGPTAGVNPPRPSENEMNLLRAQLQSRIQYSSFESLVTIKELSQTVDMIYLRLGKLAELLQACRRRNLNDIFGALGIGVKQRRRRRRIARQVHYQYQYRSGSKERIAGVSGIYLEYLFGWNQIYQDLMSLAKTAADLMERMPKVRASADPLIKERSFEFTVSDKVGEEFNGSMTGTVVDQYRLHMRFDPTFGTVMDALGLNVASAVWQMLPYSFVLNWFMDYNSFLGQFQLLASVNNIECQLTSSRELNVSVTGTCTFAFYDDRNNLVVDRDVVSNGTAKTFAISRQAESPWMTFAPVRLPSEISKAVTGAALILQRWFTPTGDKFDPPPDPPKKPRKERERPPLRFTHEIIKGPYSRFR